MGAQARERRRPPLKPETLEELALFYVARFATTRAKLRAYLSRKIRERGWEGQEPADLAGLADRLARSGYVDDAAFAVAKSQALAGRGLGPMRLDQALKTAGVADEDGLAARALLSKEQVEAALRFARRRRIGPFATTKVAPPERERALAAMLRAGHRFSVAKAILDWPAGTVPEPSEIADVLGLFED